MASHPIYEIYAELEDFEPKIWRRFQMMNNVSLARLGYVLMTLFEMNGTHLFSFTVPLAKNIKRRSRNTVYLRTLPKEVEYALTDDEDEDYDEFDDEYEDEYDDEFDDDDDNPYDVVEAKLRKVLAVPGEEACFNYDFGDCWRIKVVLKKVFEDASLPAKELPRVLKGEGFGILEDCGGVDGLTELAEAFRTKSGEAYEMFRDALGVEELDISIFNIDDMNFRLKKLPRIFKELYEDGIIPTERSLKLLMRDYMK